MTEVKFIFADSDPKGFEISGHSSFNCNDEAGKIVCSAVSSAAYMAVNTVTEIIGDKMNSCVQDGFMRSVGEDLSKGSKDVLKGFALHIKELSAQYPDRIKITTEV